MPRHFCFSTETAGRYAVAVAAQTVAVRQRTRIAGGDNSGPCSALQAPVWRIAASDRAPAYEDLAHGPEGQR